jgi:hypothetical protein
MPARPNAVGVTKLAFSGTAQGTNWANIFYFQTPHPGTIADYTFVQATASAATLRPWIHNMPTTSFLEQITYEDLSSSSGASLTFPGLHLAGTNAGTPLPANNAVLVSHKIARRYRGGHPRHYMPFGQNTDTSDSQHWTNTFITNVQNDMVAFIAAVNAAIITNWGSGEMGNLSYFTALAPRAVPVFDPFLSTTTSPLVASQRKRLI